VRAINEKHGGDKTRHVLLVHQNSRSSEECNKSWFEPAVKGRVGEFTTVCHLNVAFEKRLDGSIRSGSEAEGKRVKQRDDVEFLLSLDEIRCASRVVCATFEYSVLRRASSINTSSRRL